MKLVSVLTLLVLVSSLAAQTNKDSAAVHVAAAKTAAGQEHNGVFGVFAGTAPAPQHGPAVAAPAAAPAPPNRSTWHAEPMKVFDNLYFVGMTEYSSWAVNTSGGIIIIDAIYDYSVEDEIANGLPKVGLDPKN